MSRINSLLHGRPARSRVADGDQTLTVQRQLLQEARDLHAELLSRHKDDHPRTLPAGSRSITGLLISFTVQNSSTLLTPLMSKTF